MDNLVLAEDEVHVWHVRLAELAPELPRLQTLLSQDERERASRFHFERDRMTHCLSRAALRLLLQSYGVAAGPAIRFSYAAHGKPELAAAHNSAWLRFNLAHSHEMAVVAFAHSRQVGVDVECVRELRDADSLIAHYFSAEEQAEYQVLSPAARRRAFLNGWTRKEAFIKATGEGLSRPLDSFAVTLTPGEPVRFLRVGPDAAAASGWVLADLTLDPSYVVALAVEGTDLSIGNRVIPAAGFQF
jgi:4'-phosphopantetheinyl transferase